MTKITPGGRLTIESKPEAGNGEDFRFVEFDGIKGVTFFWNGERWEPIIKPESEWTTTTNSRATLSRVSGAPCSLL